MPRHPINAIDRHIGKRLRQRRLEVRITQQRLAEMMDISFQQLQKYEHGKNKISASRLFEVARHLKTSREYFFEGLDQSKPAPFQAHIPATSCAYTWSQTASWVR